MVTYSDCAKTAKVSSTITVKTRHFILSLSNDHWGYTVIPKITRFLLILSGFRRGFLVIEGRFRIRHSRARRRPVSRIYFSY